ncbi:hypothetical protein ABEB36_002748 [Hypothenemus hampei]|uniref:Uncharacterized protein n=1 Tax=Hypothenemus hampei TaxID=57062 RepID=A0ABD1F6W1_HYPHA
MNIPWVVLLVGAGFAFAYGQSSINGYLPPESPTLIRPPPPSIENLPLIPPLVLGPVKDLFTTLPVATPDKNPVLPRKSVGSVKFDAAAYFQSCASCNDVYQKLFR